MESATTASGMASATTTAVTATTAAMASPPPRPAMARPADNSMTSVRPTTVFKFIFFFIDISPVQADEGPPLACYMGAGGFRVIGISSMSGVFSPPTIRSRCCHVMRSLDTRVVILVAEAIFPSRVTPVIFTIQ